YLIRWQRQICIRDIDNFEIANESAIISSTVSDIANNILEDVKKKRF
ncbi:hypothetical protein ACISNL_07340, partial [Campylobacter jejuni]